ncbi:MAG: pyrroloquinoline quinone biosynthesis peptide chaperone PqqD [Acidobacteriota bacterium]|nr:pyrroloquinoline quinone biosynthesis peptide chaperone PqqD [Acidobacteriota bacterium]
MIDDRAVLERAADVRFRAVDDETVVIRQEAAEALVLNEVAGRILELVDGRRTVGEIIDRLFEEFDAPRDALAEDVCAYLRELVAAGLVLGA